MIFHYGPALASRKESGFPLITLFITFYNHAKYVNDAVTHALSQDYPNCEIILTDDASTDGTGQAILSCLNGYAGPHHVVVNINPENMGLGRHLAKMYPYCHGQWMVASSGDDLCMPDRVRRIYEYSCKYPNVTAIGSAAVRIDAKGIKTGTAYDVSVPTLYPRYGEGAFSFSLTPGDSVSLVFVTGAVSAFRMDIVKGSPYPSQIIAEDVFFSLRSIIRGDILFIPERLVCQRFDGKNMSQAGRKSKCRAKRKAYRRKCSLMHYLSISAAFDEVKLSDRLSTTPLCDVLQHESDMALFRSFALPFEMLSEYKGALGRIVRRRCVWKMLKQVFSTGLLLRLAALLLRCLAGTCAQSGNRRQWIKCIALTSLVMIVSLTLDVMTSGINVGLRLESDLSADARIEYTLREGQKFSRKRAVPVKLMGGKKNYEIIIPDRRLEGVRLVSRTTNRPIKLMCVCIHGKTFAQYESGLRVQSWYQPDFRMFLILLGTLALAWKIAKAPQKFSDWSDWAFIAVFAVCYTLPLFKFTQADTSSIENRTLAKKPNFVRLFDRDYNYTKRFEDWLGDRFFMRDKYLALWNTLMVKGNQKVIIGQDGWLYSRVFGEDIMIRNENLFSDHELDDVTNALKAFKEDASAHGVREVYFYVAADKESIYPEFYPEVRKYGSMSRREQVVAHLRQQAHELKVLDFTQDIIRKKGSGDLYFKAGTHYNDRGSYFEYSFLAREVAREFPTLEILPPSRFLVKRMPDEDRWLADVAGICYSRRRYESDAFILTNGVSKLLYTKDIPNMMQTVRIFRNEHSSNDIGLWLISDSFAERWNQYFAEGVRDLLHVFTGGGGDFNLDFVEAMRTNPPPDIIIVETCEKFLPRLLNLRFPR